MAAKHVAWFRFKDGVSKERIEGYLNAVRYATTPWPMAGASSNGDGVVR